MAKKPTRTLAQARKGIQPSEDYSPPLGFVDDDLEDYSPIPDEDEDEDTPQVINPPRAKTPEEYREQKRQRSLRAKQGARTRRINRGLKDKARITSISFDPEQYGLVRSLGRGISPVVREAVQEYLERRGIVAATPKSIDRIKEEIIEQLKKELQDGIIQIPQKKRRKKDAS